MTREARDDTKTAIVCAAIVGALSSAAGFALFGGRTGASIAVGAGLGVANLVAMRVIVRSLLAGADEADDANAPAHPSSSGAPLPGESDGAPSTNGPDEASSDAPTTERKRYAGAWGAFAIVKMFLLFGGIWLLLSKHVVDPLPLVVGYGVLPVGIVLSTLLSSLSVGKRSRRRPPKG